MLRTKAVIFHRSYPFLYSKLYVFNKYDITGSYIRIPHEARITPRTIHALYLPGNYFRKKHLAQVIYNMQDTLYSR